MKVERELENLDGSVKERFFKIKNTITKQMIEQTMKLETTWKEEKDTLDYIGLKEIKWEFNQVDNKLRFLVNEWE